MSDCHRTRDLMGPYLYEDLRDKELRFVEAHLAICLECRAEFYAIEAAIGLVPRSALEPSDDTRARIAAAVEQRAAELPTARQSRPVAGRLSTWGLAAAAMVLGVLVGYHLPRGPAEPADTRPPVVAASIPAANVLPAPEGDVGHDGRGSGETASASVDAGAAPNEMSDGHAEVGSSQTDSPEQRPSPGLRPLQTVVPTVPALRPPRPLGIDDVQVAEAVQLEVVQ